MKLWNRKWFKVVVDPWNNATASKLASDCLPRLEIFNVEWKKAARGQRIPICMGWEKGPMYWKWSRYFLYILYGIIFMTLSQLLQLNGTDKLLTRVVTGVLLSTSLFLVAVTFHICKNGDALATGVNGLLLYQFSLRSGNYL